MCPGMSMQILFVVCILFVKAVIKHLDIFRLFFGED